MPVIDSDMSIGPTIDMEQEAAQPLARQEPFQITAGRRQVNLKAAPPRPVTHKPNFQLGAGRTQVLVRDGNNNPDNAGENETVTSRWGLSDPDQLAGVGQVGALNWTLIAGAVVGGVGLLWLLNRR